MRETKHVQRGASRLDRYYPNWDRDLDPTGLDMWSPTSCVLGKLYGDYNSGLDALDLRGPGLFWGFISWLPTRKSALKLRRAWLIEIRRRQNLLRPTPVTDAQLDWLFQELVRLGASSNNPALTNQ